jgi:YHS domain-containing protein
MKAVLTLLLGLVLMGGSLAQTSVNTVSSDDGTAISGYDAVTFHTQNKAVRGDMKFQFQHAGAKWLFSTDENLKAFEKDPEKYMPAWGGQCAWAVSENTVSTKKLSGDFSLIDGKLYLFSSGNRSRSGAKDDFLYGRWSRSMRIEYGNKYWPEIKQKLETGSIVQPDSTTYRKTQFD